MPEPKGRCQRPAPRAEAEGRSHRPDLLPRVTSQATVPASRASTAPILQLYTWTEAGFGPCSASCLGGFQEAMVICVEAGKNVSMMALFCDPYNKPVASVRACNSQPCPSRWEMSGFSHCTKSCGGGVQTREVACVQEVGVEWKADKVATGSQKVRWSLLLFWGELKR